MGAALSHLVQAGVLDRAAYLMPDDGEECLFALAVTMRPAVLHVDNAYHAVGGGDDRGRQECLVPVFRQVVEELEARVLAGVPRNGHGLGFPGHPPGDPFSELERYVSDDAGMRVLRGAQYQALLGFVQEVDETRVPARDLDDEIDDLAQYLVEIQTAAYGLADLVQDLQFVAREIQSLAYRFNGIRAWHSPA